jgi:hypothetical protein
VVWLAPEGASSCLVPFAAFALIATLPAAAVFLSSILQVSQFPKSLAAPQSAWQRQGKTSKASITVSRSFFFISIPSTSVKGHSQPFHGCIIGYLAFVVDILDSSDCLIISITQLDLQGVRHSAKK